MTSLDGPSCLMTTSTRSEFSNRTRAYNLGRMRAEIFDIVVIGAGIMGAAIAREAALRGYKVVLVDKGDFGSGATTQSSQLVNFEIGDLETARFDRLYEVGQEQRRLLPLSPNHISSLPLLLPSYRSTRHDPSLVNLGMWMYDGLPLSRMEGRHQILSTEQIASFAPHLDVSDIVGGVRYYVTRTNSARLTLETIRSAHYHRAVVANYFQVVELKRTTGKRVDGIRGRDILTGQAIDVRGRVIVVAAGPWTGQLLAGDQPQRPIVQSLVKYVHVLAPSRYFPISEAIAFRAKSDRRWMFALPSGNSVLIGPRGAKYSGSPDQVLADRDDVEEILRALRESFSGTDLQRKDIISTYAELRREGSGRHALKQEPPIREREMLPSGSGPVVAQEGELTSHRSRAQHLVSQVEKILAREFGVHALHPSRSASLPLIELEGSEKTLTLRQAQAFEMLPATTREYLDSSYGARKNRVLDQAISDSKLSAPIIDGLPYIWAEIPHSVEQEMAMTVRDVMTRRMDLFHELADGGDGAVREVARYMARMLDWIDSDVEQEVRSYSEALRLNRGALRDRTDERD